jgi:hypothetical protein
LSKSVSGTNQQMHFKYPEFSLYFFWCLQFWFISSFWRFKKGNTLPTFSFWKNYVQTRKSSTQKWLPLINTVYSYWPHYNCICNNLIFLLQKIAHQFPNEMYIILDNSFSMQAKGQKGELLRRAAKNHRETQRIPVFATHHIWELLEHGKCPFSKCFTKYKGIVSCIPTR